MSQITHEELQALFIAPNADSQLIKIASEQVFRVNWKGKRMYKRKDNPRLYTSLTTFLSSVMPPSKHLQGWRDDLAETLGSAEKVDEYVQATADYGTTMHVLIGEICQLGYADWDMLYVRATELLIELGLPTKTIDAATRDVVRATAAIVKFFADYEVNVISVEIPVFSNHGFATFIDLVVEMNEKNYTKTAPEKRKRIKAIINMKSGMKGFHDSHKYQLIGEREAWNETYGSFMPITEVFNLAPSDWKKEPSYKLACQTDFADDNEGANTKIFKHWLAIAELKGDMKNPSSPIQVFEGITKFGSDPTDQLKTYFSDQAQNLIEKQQKQQQNER